MRTKVILLSGGLDSLCTLFLYPGQMKKCFWVNYGQKNADAEWDAVQRIANVFPDMYVTPLLAKGMFHYCKSSILRKDRIDTVKSAELPNRNTALVNVVASNLDPRMEWDIVVGAHKSGSGYVDCKPGFYKRLDKLLRYSTSGRIRCEAPGIHLTKEQLVAKAKKLGLTKTLASMTMSCYSGTDCGFCPACIQRQEVMKRLF
jgi:7-cyano-7-deazaguanine synthase